MSADVPIAVMKFVCAALGSVAMTGEGVHSLADSANEITLMAGKRFSHKEPSRKHPWGTSRGRYLASFMVAILLFLAGGAYSSYEAIEKMMVVTHMGIRTIDESTLRILLITNDLTAIKNVIKIRGRLLFVVINAIPSMDMDGGFRIWHDTLKGKKSKYAELGESTGRRHRARKKSVALTNIDIFDISDLSMVESMPVMKQGKNSDGNKRPEKMMIDADILQPQYSYAF